MQTELAHDGLVAFLAGHNLDLLVGILDTEDIDTVRIKCGLTMITADDLDLDGHVFDIRNFKVQSQEVAVRLIAAESPGITGDILQRTANGILPNRHIALQIIDIVSKKVEICSDVGVNGQGI